MISLQSRDKQILKLCYEQQFLTSDQIADHFFSSYREAARRIQELGNAGYLVFEKHPLKNNARALRLAERGLQVASQLSAVAIPQRWTPSQVEHDALVTRVRLILEKRWDGTWIPEKAIRGFRTGEVPDGLFIFENEAKVAVEVENSLKGRARFEDRLRRWKDIKVKIVLYVATKPEVHERLRVFLDGAPRPPLFCLTQLEELSKEDPSIWCPIGEIDLFSERTL